MSLVVCYYYRRVQGSTLSKANEASVTPSDYTIMVRYLPKKTNVEKIKEFFTEKGRKVNATNVNKVSLAYDIRNFVKLLRKRQELQAKKSHHHNNIEEIESEIHLLEEQIKDFEKRIKDDSSYKFTGIAFVTLNTEKEALDVLLNHQRTFLQSVILYIFTAFSKIFKKELSKNYDGSIITVERAPEPLDIYWENLGYDNWQIIKNRSFTYFASFLIIIVSFGLILAVNYAM